MYAEGVLREIPHIQKRNPVLVAVLSVITGGIYALYWFVKTKDEINSLGANIPTAWMLIIPVLNLYWEYRYTEGYATYVKKDGNAVLWFLLLFFVCPVAMAAFQSELNKLADSIERSQ